MILYCYHNNTVVIPPSNFSFFYISKITGVDLICDGPGKHKNSFLKILCQKSMR
jgi:hypothetical protein